MNPDFSVLILDDDEDITSLLAEYFHAFNIQVIRTHHAQDAFQALNHQHIDLLILDYMMPQLDGLDVIKLIRTNLANNPYDLVPKGTNALDQLPIIMLSARGNPMDKIICLEMGADDYVSKPFEPRELLIRVKKLIKRKQSSIQASSNHSLILERNAFSVELNGKRINLTGSEFACLEILTSEDRYFSKDELSQLIKGHEHDALSRSMDVLISRLRNKLLTLSDVNLIINFRNKGYRLKRT